MTVGLYKTSPLILSLLLGYTTAQTDTTFVADVSCPLDCKNDAPCIQGQPDFESQFGAWAVYFPFLNQNENTGYYCQCPEGFTGITCEREYETCADEEHTCFHGGKCLPTMQDVRGRNQNYCDCEKAEFDGLRYAGRFCESESVDFCHDGLDGDFFCVNGGTCQDDIMSSLDQPCHCGSGYRGPHCEYRFGENPECTLQCFNGGACQIGAKSYGANNTQYNRFWDKHDDNMYCVCPDGFFGLQCEIEGRSCGENHCFNGGTCVTKELSDGTVREFCDCSTANTDEKSYAGRFCEAESTSFCSKMPDHNGHQFCVNGGTCKAESHLGCDCLEGFNGPICEFHDAHMEPTVCDLTCQHNGVCRNGAKDLSFLKKFGLDLAGDSDESFSEDFEHCVCPRGYVGLRCEHMVQVCPGGQHICMHGGTCVPSFEDDELSFECDCGTADSPFFRFSGEYCELRSSEHCTVDGEPGIGQSRDAFCVNDGICTDHVEQNQGHPGCICNIGFTGDHCEINAEHARVRQPTHSEEKKDTTVHEDITTNKTTNKLGVGEIIAIVIGIDVILISVFAAYFVVRRRRKDDASEYGGSRADHPSFAGNLMPPAPTLENMFSVGTNIDDESTHPIGSPIGSYRDNIEDEKEEETCEKELVNVII